MILLIQLRAIYCSLWYSCHEICSTLLTETQWIYRYLIGQETKPGHIIDFAPGHDKQEIPVMCELHSKNQILVQAIYLVERDVFFSVV